MKNKRTTYHEDLIERLRDTEYALGYLNACLAEKDDGTFLLALRDVAEAHGGLRRLAAKTKLNREHLFRMLSKNGNPRLESLQNLAEAFGWRLAFLDKHGSRSLNAA